MLTCVIVRGGLSTSALAENGEESTEVLAVEDEASGSDQSSDDVANEGMGIDVAQDGQDNGKVDNNLAYMDLPKNILFTERFNGSDLEQY